jgi:hypothetical protein
VTDGLVHQQAELYSRPKAEKKNVESIENWFNKYPTAIYPPETAYISNRDDLFALSHISVPPLMRLLQKSSHFREWRIWQKAPKIADEDAVYTSETRFRVFLSIVNTIIGLTMLVVPLWILAYVNNKAKRLAIITTCVVFFLCVLNFTMVAKPSEALAATAAYVTTSLRTQAQHKESPYPCMLGTVKGRITCISHHDAVKRIV